MQGLDEICPDIPRTYASRNCRNTFCYTSLIVPDRLMPIKSIFGFQGFSTIENFMGYRLAFFEKRRKTSFRNLQVWAKSVQ
ncbi:hypothetical protein T01_13333 [Trichinella spiralis]|uniref:Uncharacterized protein n=1 Tax=Trichinella spiralis TaxID=6334 RepID=A0A0V1BA71_TRISP|nr:hypothetical protein T01_13333 [Trichinella spiralis]